MATLLIMALPEESQNRFEKAKIKVHYCGVGLTKAAYNTQKLIIEHKPARVLNLGTAGSFTSNQGTLVECSSFIQRFPQKLNLPGNSPLTSAPPISKLPLVVCGSGDFIQTAAMPRQCDIFDMEAYAMAYVCKEMNVPFNSIKYVTDSSDHNTFQDWKKNLEHASQSLFEIYSDLIEFLF